jgi:hypothetical protein
MKLYTIAIQDRPIVTLGVDVTPPMEDALTRNPKLLKLFRGSQSLIDQMSEGIDPGVAEHAEIYEAIDTWLGEDLRSLEAGQTPLWDGDQNKLEIREAWAEEADAWHESRAGALNNGHLDAGDEGWLTFLIPVTDPREEED